MIRYDIRFILCLHSIYETWDNNTSIHVYVYPKHIVYDVHDIFYTCTITCSMGLYTRSTSQTTRRHRTTIWGSLLAVGALHQDLIAKKLRAKVSFFLKCCEIWWSILKSIQTHHFMFVNSTLFPGSPGFIPWWGFSCGQISICLLNKNCKTIEKLGRPPAMHNEPDTLMGCGWHFE